MPLVAGVDSSTQSCKVVIRDAESGALVRTGSAPHPPGTSVDPQAWWDALQIALTAAGGLDDVAAIAVGGQQHGMVCLDEGGAVVRDALLWNDTRSAQASADLIGELEGGAHAWATATGSVPLASFTITKLRWLATHEPANASRTAAVCLPHDWLTWRLRGSTDIAALTTDRGDASGTGYWSPAADAYREDLLELAFGARPLLPTVLGPRDAAGTIASGAVVGPGTGDNAAATLGVGARRGDVVVSIGTSGVVCAIHPMPTADPTGIVAGFADASGAFLPLVCTLNAARVLEATARMLGVDLAGLSRLALEAPPGSDGLVLVPYFDGERTPNRPDASGSLLGLTHANATPTHVARATVEGLLCGLADGLDALRAESVAIERVVLVGGGARSPALRQIAPTVFGTDVIVPEPGEYVADGAARQAAWVLSGADAPPVWELGPVARYTADRFPSVRERYAQVRELTATRLESR
jgi:xylulokinase